MRTLIRTPAVRLPARDWCEAAPATGKGVDRLGRAGHNPAPRPRRRDPSVPGADTHPELLPSGRAGESISRAQPSAGRSARMALSSAQADEPHCASRNHAVYTLSPDIVFAGALSATVRPLPDIVASYTNLTLNPRVCGQPGQIRHRPPGNRHGGRPARVGRTTREALRQRILRSAGRPDRPDIRPLGAAPADSAERPSHPAAAPHARGAAQPVPQRTFRSRL